MVILSETDDLERLCSESREALRRLGAAGARRLQTRLAELEAAARVTELVAGHPHPLKGGRAGQFAVNLDGGRRLVCEPADDPLPLGDGGEVDWARVTTVRVTYIGDYHD